MRILVTGGAGYIGSHTCVALLEGGYDLTVVDNLSNSKEESLKRVKKITGKDFEFHKTDLTDRKDVERIFDAAPVDAVIHFAGLKAVGESVEIPLRYFSNNLISTLVLCEVMAERGLKDLVFSSSCTVYGEPETVPVTEAFPLSCASPYGRTKLIIEDMLRDVSASDAGWNIALLRYFNPAGAHPSGRIGEDPNGIPNNLLPYVTQVAVGRLEYVRVFGNDYPTPDGTGVRDYIHVSDLAAGHLKALEKLAEKPGLVTYNLGTGRGYSVLEVIAAFEKVSGKKVPYRIMPRRPGDIATAYADPSRARAELGWEAALNLEDMVRDSWRWQQDNPDGFA